MHKSFGIHSQHPSARWGDVAKGPSLVAVREHLYRIATFSSASAPNTPEGGK